MAKATCTSCGERYAFNKFDPNYEPWMPPQCPDCTLASNVCEALQLFKDGDHAKACDVLAEFTSDWPDTTSTIQTLINEAEDAAKRHDFDEAALRLRCACDPKWSSTKDCKEQYMPIGLTPIPPRACGK